MDPDWRREFKGLALAIYRRTFENLLDIMELRHVSDCCRRRFARWMVCCFVVVFFKTRDQPKGTCSARCSDRCVIILDPPWHDASIFLHN